MRRQMRRWLSSAPAAASKLKVAVVLERRPVIYHVEPWEVEFEAWQTKALRSQQGRPDVIPKLSLQNKTGSKSAGKGDESIYAVKKKKLDLAAEYEALKRFNVTDADRSGEKNTLMRALSRRLYLVVRSEQDGWHFPTVDLGSASTLRAAADEAATAALNPLPFFMFGNCPVGHVGGKTFFFMGEVVWDNGMRIPDVSKIVAKKEQQWVTRDEISQLLQPGEYLDATNKMLSLI